MSAPLTGLLNIYEPLGTHTTPAVCVEPSFLPFLLDGELTTFVPWPSQPQLSVHRMIRSVKTMLSSPTFHLHWQPEEHNSAPRGAKKALHPNDTIQSDNWAVNPRERSAAFRLDYLFLEFWTARRWKTSSVVFFRASMLGDDSEESG